MQILAQQFRQFINENFLFGQANGHLGDDDSFLEGDLIDSTGVLELINFVETTCGIRFDDEDLVPENLDSISNLVQFVAKKRAQSLSPGEAHVGAVLS